MLWSLHSGFCGPSCGPVRHFGPPLDRFGQCPHNVCMTPIQNTMKILQNQHCTLRCCCSKSWNQHARFCFFHVECFCHRPRKLVFLEGAGDKVTSVWSFCARKVLLRVEIPMQRIRYKSENERKMNDFRWLVESSCLIVGQIQCLVVVFFSQRVPRLSLFEASREA